MLPDARRTDKVPVQKEPKANPKVWYEPGEAMPNASEIIFFALALCVSAESVSELDKWAGKVLVEEARATAMMSDWQPPSSSWPVKNGTSEIYRPLVEALEKKSWSREENESVALAMQAWRGDGQVDGLNAQHLKTYRLRPPSAP